MFDEGVGLTATFDEVGEMLDEIACELPKEFFNGLNGGINLIPGVKLHPESDPRQTLYIAGEYHRDGSGLGRWINIYYGSIMIMHAWLTPPQLREELKRVLVHEFTHHLESLAGENGLEVKDAEDLEAYKHRLNP